MMLVGLLLSYKSVLHSAHSPVTTPVLSSYPSSSPPSVHPRHVLLPSACFWAFSPSMESGCAGEMAFGKLSKDPPPLYSLRFQDHRVTGRTSLYLPPYPYPLTYGRPSLPISHHLARLLIACCSPCFGHGYTCFNFVSQIRAWTLRRTRRTNRGGPSLQASYPLMMHAICAGCYFLCAFPFL